MMLIFLAVTLYTLVKSKAMMKTMDRVLQLKLLNVHVNLPLHKYIMPTVPLTLNVLTSKLRLATTQKTIQLLFQTTQLSKVTVYVVVLSVLLMLTWTCYVFVTLVTLVNLHSAMVSIQTLFHLSQLTMLLHLMIQQQLMFLIVQAIQTCQTQNQLLQLHHIFKTQVLFRS